VTQFSFIINSNRDGDPYLELLREWGSWNRKSRTQNIQTYWEILHRCI